MRFSVTILCFVFSLSQLGSGIAHAQGHSMYCSHAKSTAETQKCLNRHVESAQNRLNEVYTKLTTLTEGEALDRLKSLQAKWVEYRDLECSWEKDISSEEALHRSKELSCLARITEDRADMLTVILEGERENAPAREFGSFPRWMNVAAKENPSVFWDYKARRAVDLDCDAATEYVMSGVSLQKSNSEEEIVHEAKYHVAVAENPAVGLPGVRLFSFPVMKGDGLTNVCSIRPSIDVSEGSKGPVPIDSEAESCSARLTIKTNKCPDRVISWIDGDYALEKTEQIIQEEENKKETKK